MKKMKVLLSGIILGTTLSFANPATVDAMSVKQAQSVVNKTKPYLKGVGTKSGKTYRLYSGTYTFSKETKSNVYIKYNRETVKILPNSTIKGVGFTVIRTQSLNPYNGKKLSLWFGKKAYSVWGSKKPHIEVEMVY